MDRQMIERIVAGVMTQLGQTVSSELSEGEIPVSVSARHVHLSPEHVEVLFGKGYALTRKSDLSQPGQFASNETVMIAGPKGSLERVRVLGPSRDLTQAEISWTDAVKIGVRPPLRTSGDIKGSAPLTMIGPSGSLALPEGLIIAQAHIHMGPVDAKQLNVQNGEFVQVKINGERPLSIDKVMIRVSDRFRLEMHIDTDEANAGLITSGSFGRIVNEHISRCAPSANYSQEINQRYEFNQKLLAYEHVQSIQEPEIILRKGTIVTPLAKDLARELGKDIIFIK